MLNLFKRIVSYFKNRKAISELSLQIDQLDAHILECDRLIYSENPLPSRFRSNSSFIDELYRRRHILKTRLSKAKGS